LVLKKKNLQSTTKPLKKKKKKKKKKRSSNRSKRRRIRISFYLKQHLLGTYQVSGSTPKFFHLLRKQICRHSRQIERTAL
jgi:hypothetical protein